MLARISSVAFEDAAKDLLKQLRGSSTLANVADSIMMAKKTGETGSPASGPSVPTATAPPAVVAQSDVDILPSNQEDFQREDAPPSRAYCSVTVL